MLQSKFIVKELELFLKVTTLNHNFEIERDSYAVSPHMLLQPLLSDRSKKHRFRVDLLKLIDPLIKRSLK